MVPEAGHGDAESVTLPPYERGDGKVISPLPDSMNIPDFVREGYGTPKTWFYNGSVEFKEHRIKNRNDIRGLIHWLLIVYAKSAGIDIKLDSTGKIIK